MASTGPRVVTAVPQPILVQARQIREALHRHPELAFAEHQTAALIARSLRDSGLEVTEAVAGTGVVGLLRGAGAGPTLALRADMDALAIPEQTGLPYASEVPGAMHACGHDGHTAILLMAARLLAAERETLRGQVKFIFQPAEEQGTGARRMIEAGVLGAPHPVAAIFALHARPQIQLGQIELCEIPSAATNGFRLRVTGRGCHAAYPHLGVDPIVIGAQIVSALQQIISRQVAPADPAVVTVGAFHAGAQRNVIPAEAVLDGTLRSRDPLVQRRLIAAVREIAQGVAHAMGGGCEVEVEPGTPRVRNDPRLLALAAEVGREVLGETSVLTAREPTMGGEDFAFFLEEQGGVPGCMFRLGVATDAPVHTDRFDFGHEALDGGIRMMASLARRFLADAGEGA